MKARIVARPPFLLTFFALLLSLFAPSPLVAAVQTPSTTRGNGQALEIAPPVMTLTAKPGQTIQAQISLRNISSGPLVVQGQVNDFTAAGEDGTPKILTEEGEANPYSMRSWVGALPSLTLQPRQIRSLPVSITVPAKAAPGGYYGVVRFTGRPPELEGTGVSLSASLGALMLVRVSGISKEGLAVEEFFVAQDGKTATLFESTPLQFVQRLKNIGNVHEQPVGQVTITDMFGKKVAAVNVNLPPRNILPQSIRRFEQSLDTSTLGSRLLFGRYQADLTLSYGTNKQTLTSSTTFWVIPYRLIGAGITALIVGFFVLRFTIRRYNRHIISRAQKRR